MSIKLLTMKTPQQTVIFYALLLIFGITLTILMTTKSFSAWMIIFTIVNVISGIAGAVAGLLVYQIHPKTTLFLEPIADTITIVLKGIAILLSVCVLMYFLM